jgi:methyl-accepting chemotaxis protein
LNLGTKLISGFGIVSLLLLLVVGLSWNGLNTVASGYKTLLSDVVPIVNESYQVEGQILECRRNEKDFLARHDLKYRDNLDSNIQILEKHGAVIKELGKKNNQPQIVAFAEDIDKAAEQYQATFHDIVGAWEAKGLKPSEGIQGEFRAAAHSLATELAGSQVDDLSLALSTIRRYEKDYRLTGKDKYKDKWTAAVATYEYRLEASSCSESVKMVQRPALMGYQDSQVAYLASSDEAARNELYKTLRQSAHIMESSLSSIALPGARAMLLEIRKQEKDYLLRYDTKDSEGQYTSRDKYFKKTNLAVEALLQACRRAEKKGFDPDLTKTISRELDIYSEAFAGLVEKDDEIRNLGGEMKVASYKIAPLVTQIIELAQNESVAASTAMESNAKSAQLLALIIGGLAVVLGMGIGIFLTRSITVPINRVISGMQAGSEQVASASGQVSQSSQQLAEGASEQASSLEETSASLEMMSAGARDSATNSDQASTRANEVKGNAEKGKKAMVELTEAMEKIKNSSDETAKIIKTIDEIAFQTNLLALNAAVEAARAGDAGKGFAVVAEEVRNLAQRSAEAAKGTASLIDGSKENSDLGVKATNVVSEILEDVVVGIVEVSGVIKELSDNSSELARSVGEVNTAVGQMDSVTQSNAAGSEESASAAEEMSAQATDMQRLVQDLIQIIRGESGAGAQTFAGQVPHPAQQSIPSNRKVANHKQSQGNQGVPDEVVFLDEESMIEL